MRRVIVMIFLAALLTGGAVSGAQVSVGIRIGAPPAARVVRVHPRQPGPEYVWLNGYWYPVGHKYKWHDGYWTRPPYQGAHWTEARYDGRMFYDGYWDGERGRSRHDHQRDRNRDRDYRDDDRGRDDRGRDDRNRGGSDRR
jgi:hypothetical protein